MGRQHLTSPRRMQLDDDVAQWLRDVGQGLWLDGRIGEDLWADLRGCADFIDKTRGGGPRSWGEVRLLSAARRGSTAAWDLVGYGLAVPSKTRPPKKSVARAPTARKR
jgi:hypothetical protein